MVLRLYNKGDIMIKRTLLCLLVVATGAFAQTTSTTTTKTTTTTGTVAEFAPGTQLVIKETTGPMTYRYADDVTYVTRSGTVIEPARARTLIKVGTPVSVDYITRGDTRLVNRVVLSDDALEDIREADDAEDVADAVEDSADDD